MGAAFRSGLVTFIGRPNVGKSSLLNRLVGSKISITSSKPQTTRFRILGIATGAQTQAVYVDTPGLHPRGKTAMSRYMNRVARDSLEGVDCVVLVITADGWREEDDHPFALARALRCPVILALNKMDRLKDRRALLPLIGQSAAKLAFSDIVPVSAKNGENMEALESAIHKHLPEQPPLYPPGQLTDRSERFLAAEFIREQVFRISGQEVPYAAAVEVERFQRVKGMLHISAVIWVEKEGQKAILIGKGGERMKKIGRGARLAMERLFGSKVRLDLWVKVREGWSQEERALRSLGYNDRE